MNPKQKKQKKTVYRQNWIERQVGFIFRVRYHEPIELRNEMKPGGHRSQIDESLSQIELKAGQLPRSL